MTFIRGHVFYESGVASRKDPNFLLELRLIINLFVSAMGIDASAEAELAVVNSDGF